MRASLDNDRLLAGDGGVVRRAAAVFEPVLACSHPPMHRRMRSHGAAHARMHRECAAMIPCWSRRRRLRPQRKAGKCNRYRTTALPLKRAFQCPTIHGRPRAVRRPLPRVCVTPSPLLRIETRFGSCAERSLTAWAAYGDDESRPHAGALKMPRIAEPPQAGHDIGSLRSVTVRSVENAPHCAQLYSYTGIGNLR